MRDMSRAESIEVLKDIVSKPMLYSNHIIGACRVALASLETDEAYQLMEEQPVFCEDCISKSDALDSINWAYNLSDAYEKINMLPSVLPKVKWIPVSERLPEESYNSVLGWDAYRERCVLVQYIDGRFQIAGKTESFDIRAWMPLPQPYEGVE